MKKKNSKPSLTNSTKHLLKCPVTKPSFPLFSSPNISFKTTPKLQTQPQIFFCLFVKKTVPYFSAWLVGLLIQSTPPMKFLYFQKYTRRKVIFCDTQPPIFGQKLLLTPPTATPTSVTVVTTLRRRNVPNSKYYEKNFDSQKRKKSLEEEEILREIKQEPTKKWSLEEWIRS